MFSFIPQEKQCTACISILLRLERFQEGRIRKFQGKMVLFTNFSDHTACGSSSFPFLFFFIHFILEPWAASLESKRKSRAANPVLLFLKVYVKKSCCTKSQGLSGSPDPSNVSSTTWLIQSSVLIAITYLLNVH